jgi:hypothetical protein
MSRRFGALFLIYSFLLTFFAQTPCLCAHTQVVTAPPTSHSCCEAEDAQCDSEIGDGATNCDRHKSCCCFKKAQPLVSVTHLWTASPQYFLVARSSISNQACFFMWRLAVHRERAPPEIRTKPQKIYLLNRRLLV